MENRASQFNLYQTRYLVAVVFEHSFSIITFACYWKNRIDFQSDFKYLIYQSNFILSDLSISILQNKVSNFKSRVEFESGTLLMKFERIATKSSHAHLVMALKMGWLIVFAYSLMCKFSSVNLAIQLWFPPSSFFRLHAENTLGGLKDCQKRLLSDRQEFC